jgi:hypothetical protein
MKLSWHQAGFYENPDQRKVTTARELSAPFYESLRVVW